MAKSPSKPQSKGKTTRTAKPAMTGKGKSTPAGKKGSSSSSPKR